MKPKMSRTGGTVSILLMLGTGIAVVAAPQAQEPRVSSPSQNSANLLRGEGPLNDWNNERPGNRHLIRPADLPKPYASESATNASKVAPRPQNAWPQAPEGFKVELLLTGLEQPRNIVTAPNGDFFLTESTAGRVRVLHGLTPQGKPNLSEVFASGLIMPYGIAFYPPGPNPQYVYVANTNSIVRFPYRDGDLKARGAAEPVVTLPGGAQYGGGHWTRNIAFSNDGKKLFVAVGSHSNINDDDAEKNRADVLEFNADGSGQRIYASGIRNPSGIGVHPVTGQVWVAVNERDQLGDDLVPDYVTHIADGGFYGWPWYYTGSNQDPRHAGKHPELKDKSLVPDVLLQSHSAPLALAFYSAQQFPIKFRDSIFVTSHGSWNRAHRTGYKIIRISAPQGSASPEYEDFVTGFVRDDGNVWGRPVGVTVAGDGSLVFTDDASGSVWRVSYVVGSPSSK